jgi:hypothetical protein
VVRRPSAKSAVRCVASAGAWVVADSPELLGTLIGLAAMVAIVWFVLTDE